ncbi:MAG: hypothetical protein ACYSR9_12490 [Planctomycetota bacterium]|jgi:hypothetical protein
MQKLILISAVSILILVQICAAQSGNSGKENTNREAVRRKRRIEQLINERKQLKKFLAEHERILNLYEIDKKHDEYVKKLELVRKMQVVGIPREIPEKYGDDWRGLYSQIRGIVSGMIVVRILDSEMELFPRMMYSETEEKRLRTSRHFGIFTPISEADKFWEECKVALTMRMSDKQRRLCQLQAKYDIPDIVVQHAEEDSKKEYHMYACKYLVALFSKETVQESKRKLENIESELSNYPDRKEIEQELLQPLSPSVSRTEVETVVNETKRVGLGQVIEKKVHHNAPNMENCLDVETGSVLTPLLDDDMLNFRWLKANGIDFSGIALPDFRSLNCVGSQMVPATNELWDNATVDLLKQSLKDTSSEAPLFIETERRLIKDDLPVTYVFHTREGSIGTLQILKVEVRQALDIRYKILAFGVETEKVKVESN